MRKDEFTLDGLVNRLREMEETRKDRAAAEMRNTPQPGRTETPAESCEADAWSVLNRRHSTRRRLSHALGSVDVGRLTFDELIARIRAEASLSTHEVSDALRMTSSHLAGIEKGHVDISVLSPDKVATVLEVFSISVSLYQRCNANAASRERIRTTLSAPSARASADMTQADYANAIDDVTARLAARHEARSDRSAAARDDCLVETLRRRGRTDLL